MNKNKEALKALVILKNHLDRCHHPDSNCYSAINTIMLALTMQEQDVSETRQIIVQTPPIPESLVIDTLKHNCDDWAKRFYESENIRYEMSEKMREMEYQIFLLKDITEKPNNPQPVDFEGVL